MTRKQMKKLANQVYQCELIHWDENSSEEEKRDADNRVMKLTQQIMALHDGMNILLEIDELVQQLNKHKGDN